MGKNRIQPIIPNTKFRSSISAPNIFPKIGHIIFTEDGIPNKDFISTIPPAQTTSTTTSTTTIPPSTTTSTTSTTSTTTSTTSTTTTAPPSLVIIGSQIWTTSNLDVTTYRDGTPIPEVTDATEWTNLTTGAWCWYDNNPALGSVYGKLYNWYAVAGIYDAASLSNPSLRKNIAPVGFHVPTHIEWNILYFYVGNNTSPLTSVAYGGTNSSGFNGLPNGYRLTNGGFANIGAWWEWWAIDIDPQQNLPYNIYYDTIGGPFYNYGWYPGEGAAVRLIKD